MRLKYLVWDDENTLHIARHSVTQKEVEEACRGRFWYKQTKYKRYLFLGRTFYGRYLFWVMRDLGKGRFRVITARDMTDSERKLYGRKVI